MFNRISFQIILVSSGSKKALGYSFSETREEIILGDFSSTPLEFYIEDIPPFLQTEGGLYLGKIYNPTVIIEKETYYLQRTSSQNQYLLSKTPVGELFGLAFLQPRLEWNRPYDINTIYFEFFNPGSSQAYLISNLNQKGILIYSPLECQGGLDYCGINPPDSPPGGFGIRSFGEIYTYKISPDQKQILVSATPNYLISADLETKDIVRERWFYADGPFQVGGEYPIYIWVDREKKYLSQPQRLSENGPTVYTLTSTPEKETAKFAPLVATNWAEMNLKPDDFINLAFNNITPLSIWSEDSLRGFPAVLEEPKIALPNTISFPESSPDSPTQISGIPQALSFLQTNSPLPWKNWWFWLLVAVVVIGIIILIILLIKKGTPKQASQNPSSSIRNPFPSLQPIKTQ